jgi:hypothetical protein
MKRLMVSGFVLAGVCLAGCTKSPSREEFFAKEAKCVQYYCASNAPTAEAALLECARYAEQCQKAGVKGILYDDVFARIYDRLYLVERHLGHSAEAEQCLQKYARFHAVSSTLARQTGRPHGEMERLIEQKFDHGLQTAWKTQRGTNATGRSP